jgi:hypothetical protein
MFVSTVVMCFHSPTNGCVWKPTGNMKSLVHISFFTFPKLESQNPWHNWQITTNAQEVRELYKTIISSTIFDKTSVFLP